MNLQQAFNSPAPQSRELLESYPSILTAYEQEIESLEHESGQNYSRADDASRIIRTVRRVVEHFEDALRTHPHDPDSYLDLAIAYNLLCKWDELIVVSTKAIALYDQSTNPDRTVKAVVAHFLRGYAYASLASRQRDKEGEDVALDDLNRAVADLEEAVKLKEDYSYPYYYLGALYSDLRRWMEAEAAFKKTIELNPGFGKAHSDLGVLYQQLNRPQEALEAFERAVQVEPHNAISLSNLGQAYGVFERWGEAKAPLERSVELGHTTADTYNILGVTYLKLEELSKAEEALKKSIQLSPDKPDAHSNLGAVYYKLDHVDDAERELLRALELVPDYHAALSNLKLIRLDTLEDAVKSKFEVLKQGAEIDVDGLIDEIAKDRAEIFGTSEPNLVNSFTPEDLLSTLSPIAEQMDPDLRFRFGAKLFERGWLSSGKAARLAGMERVDFLMDLHKVGVAAIDLDEEQLESQSRYVNSQ
jgi:tetratricopeptide (TPR) repeat protein/predicted HTH domain antitoxin